MAYRSRNLGLIMQFATMKQLIEAKTLEKVLSTPAKGFV
jgi:hypothetical protein